MILTEVDSVQQQSTPNRQTSIAQQEQDYRVRQGEFIGLVQFRRGEYSFLVRDTRRQRPTIYGSKSEFESAITAMSQLLDALDDKR